MEEFLDGNDACVVFGPEDSVELRAEVITALGYCCSDSTRIEEIGDVVRAPLARNASWSGAKALIDNVRVDFVPRSGNTSVFTDLRANVAMPDGLPFLFSH